MVAPKVVQLLGLFIAIQDSSLPSKPTNGCLFTFNSSDSSSPKMTNLLLSDGPHTLTPAFTIGETGISFNISIITSDSSDNSTDATTTAPVVKISAITTSKPSEREVESDFELLDLRKHKTRSSSSSSLSEERSNSDESLDEMDLLSGREHFARLVFQGPTETTTTEVPTTADTLSTTLDAMSTTATTESDPSTTTTSSTSTDATTTSDQSNQSTTTAMSSDTTTQATSGNGTTTTADMSATTTESSREARLLDDIDQQKNNTTEDDVQSKPSDLEKQSKQEKVAQSPDQDQNKIQNIDSKEDDLDFVPIRPVFNGGIKGGEVKGGVKGGKKSRDSPSARLREFNRNRIPVFAPRHFAESRISSASSSPSRNGSRRQTRRRANSKNNGRNGSNNRNRKRRRNNSNRSSSSDSSERRTIRNRNLVSSASNRRSLRADPLPSSFSPGYSDVPVRYTTNARRYYNPSTNYYRA